MTIRCRAIWGVFVNDEEIREMAKCVSPPPPPIARIALWCECLLESLDILMRVGWKASISFFWMEVSIGPGILVGLLARDEEGDEEEEGSS